MSRGFRHARLLGDRGNSLAQLLAQCGRVATYSRGQAIVDLEAAPDAIYVVEAGRVKISVTSRDGKEQILALLQPGDLFGDALPGPSPIRVRGEAFEVAAVRAVPRLLFEDLISRIPTEALLVIRALARRVRTLECALADLGLRDVPGRLAAALLRLADEDGEPVAKGWALSSRLTHRDLASLIGSTRETVTALLNRFQSDGLVLVDHRVIVIRDREALARLAPPFGQVEPRAQR